MYNKLCFVILHYGHNINLTLNAVFSIRKLESAELADIIIVCNGREYDIRLLSDSNFLNSVDVIVLEKNTGFSAGNNAGYQYAKKKDDYDFIIFINNDVEIQQKKFINILYSVYERHNFYICGPDIYIPYKSYHASPISDRAATISKVMKYINDKSSMIIECGKIFSLKAFKFYLIEAFAGRDIFSGISKFWRKMKRNNAKFEEEQRNVVLQGACLIFSREYICCNEKAFVPEVFLYFEEDYLAERCRKNGWEMFYTNQLQVLHFHRGSSGLIGLNYRDYCKKKIDIDKIFIGEAKRYKEYILHK